MWRELREVVGRVGDGETQNKRIAMLIDLRSSVGEIGLTSGSEAQSTVGLLGRREQRYSWPV